MHSNTAIGHYRTTKMVCRGFPHRDATVWSIAIFPRRARESRKHQAPYYDILSAQDRLPLTALLLEHTVGLCAQHRRRQPACTSRTCGVAQRDTFELHRDLLLPCCWRLPAAWLALCR